jgi:hypothetical protein
MRRTDLESACQQVILALPQSAEPFRTLCARPREPNWHTRMPVCRLTIVIRRDAIGFRSSAIAGQITASDEARLRRRTRCLARPRLSPTSHRLSNSTLGHR